MADAVAAEVAESPVGRASRGSRGERRDQRRLEGQALHRADAGGLLGQPVGAEREGQHQRDPGRPAVVDGEHDDRQRPRCPCATHCSRRSRSPEHDDAHQHGHQRVDEVAERGLDDAPVVDALDVGRPVDGDDGGREHQQQRGAPVATRIARSCRVRRSAHDEQRHRRAPTRRSGGPGSRSRRRARGAGSRAGTHPRARTPRPRRRDPVATPHAASIGVDGPSVSGSGRDADVGRTGAISGSRSDCRADDLRRSRVATSARARARRQRSAADRAAGPADDRGDARASPRPSVFRPQRVAVQAGVARSTTAILVSGATGRRLHVARLRDGSDDRTAARAAFELRRCSTSGAGGAHGGLLPGRRSRRLATGHRRADLDRPTASASRCRALRLCRRRSDDGPGVAAVDQRREPVGGSPSERCPGRCATWARAWSSYVGRSTWRKIPIGERCR